MKRARMLPALALCLLMLAGCGTVRREEASSVQDSKARIWSVEFVAWTGWKELSSEDAEVLEDILASDGWVEDIPKCEQDAHLKSDKGDSCAYHSECGTLYDEEQKRFLVLEDEDKLNLDNILRKHGELSIDLILE